MRQKTFTYIKEMPYTRTPKVGEKVVLISYEPENSNAVRWHFSYDIEGIGGNMNNQIKRLHGWRGTTDGTAKYAHGVREVLKVVEFDKDGYEYVKLTVGKDLTPDEE